MFMDMALIQGAISGLKLAGDITKSLIEIKSMSEIQAKVIELQSVILSAQGSALSAHADQAAMVEEIRTLKEEIARVKAWESQKQRYKLNPIGEDCAVAYLLKESMSNSEPPHWICTKCYEDGKRMILQPTISPQGFAHLVCPSCKLDIPVHKRRAALPVYAKD
jgi:hypothetical protein